MVSGYAAGYNQALEDGRRDGSADPRCRDASWVRPIRDVDVWRRVYRVTTLLGSGGVLTVAIATAQPPATGAPAAEASPRAAVRRVRESLSAARRYSAGSNAIALGSDATVNRRGLLLANPHFPWDGPERFYEAHLRIPGEIDVFGASLLAMPLIGIGHNADLAWTHTVSTAQRWTPYQLRLLPGDATAYVVDDDTEPMTTLRVKVMGLEADGQLRPHFRTMYGSRYGPLIELPGAFDWSEDIAFAVRDANARNLRLVDTWLAMAKATSVRDLERVINRHQGLPFVNTIAADAGGEAMYADLSAVPHVTDQRASRCITTEFGEQLFAATGLPLLDGSDSSCRWGTDSDSVAAGLFGPARQPVLFRRDFVANSNDSHWLSNPEEPLVGFPRIIGDERTERSLRTRLGIRMVQERLSEGEDHPADRFDAPRLQALVFNNRSYGGELVKRDLVRLCEDHPTVTLADGTVVRLPRACAALRGWDGHANLQSTGAHLFREFMLRKPSQWLSVPFDPADPVDTPRLLDRSRPAVLVALGEAVRVLRRNHIPLTAPLGTVQTEPRGAIRIPIHGGHEVEGVFNMIIAPLRGHAGYPKVQDGSSFVMVTGFDGRGPRTRAILTYSQSTDPRSPFYADQTHLYSDKQWVTQPFTEKAIRVDERPQQYGVRSR
jgi:acyl-homoserine-lactone acylase